jgi:hypothetical protein
MTTATAPQFTTLTAETLLNDALASCPDRHLFGFPRIQGEIVQLNAKARNLTTLMDELTTDTRKYVDAGNAKAAMVFATFAMAASKLVSSILVLRTLESSDPFVVTLLQRAKSHLNTSLDNHVQILGLIRTGIEVMPEHYTDQGLSIANAALHKATAALALTQAAQAEMN